MPQTVEIRNKALPSSRSCSTFVEYIKVSHVYLCKNRCSLKTVNRDNNGMKCLRKINTARFLSSYSIIQLVKWTHVCSPLALRCDLVNFNLTKKEPLKLKQNTKHAARAKRGKIRASQFEVGWLKKKAKTKNSIFVVIGCLATDVLNKRIIASLQIENRPVWVL